MNTNDQSILVIGASGTGKTHYGVQLLGRLRQRCSTTLALDGPIDDLTAFEEGLRALEMGTAAEHTAQRTYQAVQLGLRNEEGALLRVVWPDYGGEQIKDVINQRSLNDRWQHELQGTRRWILFIRPAALTDRVDLEAVVTRLQAGTSSRSQRNALVHPWDSWDENAKLIELLQIFLHFADCSTARPISTPRLAVMLSCWDELPQEQQARGPQAVLAQALPLLTQFIDANWQRSAWATWGLSSLGRALPKGGIDKEFALTGPEHAGYVIMPEGEHNDDLTLPLKWLVDVRA